MMVEIPPTDWLLAAETPSIRYLTLRKLLDLSENSSQVRQARREMAEQGPIPGILTSQSPTGAWQGESSYYTPKYTSSHWSMLLLAELHADPQDDRLPLGASNVMHSTHKNLQQYLSGELHGWTCLWANMLRYVLYCGLENDPRMLDLIGTLVKDGLQHGWRCEYNGEQPCAWGAARTLWAFAALPENMRASEKIRQTIESACTFLLEDYDILKANYPTWETGKTHPIWFRLNFPLFYQADRLLILRALAELNMLHRPGAQRALDWLAGLQKADGRWRGASPFHSRYAAALAGREETQRWVTLWSAVVLKASSI